MITVILGLLLSVGLTALGAWLFIRGRNNVDDYLKVVAVLAWLFAAVLLWLTIVDAKHELNYRALRADMDIVIEEAN